MIILTIIDCFEKNIIMKKKTKQDLAISQAENRENEEILDIKGLAGQGHVNFPQRLKA